MCTIKLNFNQDIIIFARLRRSSESLHRDMIYDKQVWGGQATLQPQAPVVDIRTSPQTTERRKRFLEHSYTF